MGVGKKRTFAHVKGELGVSILKKCFPEEWVVREYTPDYGIDLSVEFFTQHNGGYITAGEHLLFQVKATERVDKMFLDIKPRYSVEKAIKQASGKTQKTEVIKYLLDTDLLATVEKMGSAVPVILTVVETTSEEVYFLCLNDYLEKVLIPNDPDYTNKKSKMVYIPTANSLKTMGTRVIEWYAKRAKLYAFFNKIHAQANDLKYCSEYELREEVQHFLGIILRSDVWSACEYFPALQYVKNEIDYYIQYGITKTAEDVINGSQKAGIDVDEEIWDAPYCNSPVSYRELQTYWGVRHLWKRLENVGDIFEDTIKEYFLPTYINAIG